MRGTPHLTPFDPSWTDVETGQVVEGAITRDGRSVVIPTSLGALRIDLYAWGVRLRLGDPAPTTLITPTSKADISVITEADDDISIESSSHRLAIDKDRMAMSLSAQGRPILSSATDARFDSRPRLPALGRLKNGWVCHLGLPSDARVYGLGEKWGPLNRRGQLLYGYNEDPLGVNGEASHKNIPFAWLSTGGGFYVHTTGPVMHSIGFAPWSQRALGIVTEDPSLDLFLFTGRTGKDVIDQLTALAGRPHAPPPDWALGPMVSKAWFRSEEELISTAKEIRARKMPCDTIILDGRTWQDTDNRFCFEWDGSRFPDPEATLATLKAEGFKVGLWEYPLIAQGTPLFEEMSEQGWLLQEEGGAPYLHRWDDLAFGDSLSPLPPSALVDFTHPDAYAFWRDAHAPLFEMGVDFIKADHGEQVSRTAICHSGLSGHLLHNHYAAHYNQCIYDATQRYGTGKPFQLSRAGAVGTHRLCSPWGGNPQADWEGLASSIRGGLSWGMTGGPFYTTDIGGFYGDRRDPKLYVRWLQAAIFSAHVHFHGIGDRVPWSYGPMADKAARSALSLRMRLLPWLKKEVAIAARTGQPLNRAMPLAFPDEPQAWSFEEQFVVGENVLVAPCLRPDGKVQIYLPTGDWTRFPDATLHQGGTVLSLTLALDQMAVFVRKGTSIPLGPDIDRTKANPRLTTVSERWDA